MYGSQLYTNRNEFIEKFREQQGLTPLPDFNSSRFDTQIKQQIEGRWEYLHKLEKLKRIKLEEKRKEKTQKEYEKEFNECTFNPKINNFTPKLNSHKSFVNSQSKSIEQTNLDSSNLLGRQEIWNQKKNMKIETIKQSQTNDELKECHFKPLINSPERLKKVEINNSAKNLLVDPESFEMYVTRQNRKRENDRKQIERERSLPGSGKIWRKKLTKPINLNVTNTSRDIHCYNVKSLPKPINPTKFSQVTNNYRSSDLRKEKTSRSMLSSLICSKRGEDFIYDELDKSRGEAIKLNTPMEYKQALNLLHDELYSIDLMGYES